VSDDPDTGVGFGYVMNLWSFRIGEPRASNLAAGGRGLPRVTEASRTGTGDKARREIGLC